MSDIGLAAQSLADQAERFAAFVGVITQNPEDRLFLLMGMTGSGKSHFIARCTRTTVDIGHGLQSCTDSIDVFSFIRNGRRIHLIDTPGFNDTNRSNIDTLSILATYLGASYANGVRIHGLILLHPISDNRMSGSSLRNIEMVSAICGFASYNNLAIATTMWPKEPSGTEPTVLRDRESELAAEDRFFGDFISRGATLFRHNDLGPGDPFKETASAYRIVDHLVLQSDLHPPEVLQLQQEIIDQGKTLGETMAGGIIAGDLYRVRQIHERQLKELKKEMNRQLNEMDTAHVDGLDQLKTDVEGKLKELNDAKRTMRKTMQDLHMEETSTWEKKLNEIDRRFRKHLKEKEEELQNMEDSLREIRKDQERRPHKHSQTKQANRQAADREKMVISAREEVSKTRDTYQKVQGKTGNMVNGLMSGLASGTTSGIIAGAVAGGLLCVIQ